MRSLNQIARTLSGRTRLEERAELASADTYTLIGTATSDSENGSVRIRLTDSVTRAGWDEEGTDIEVPTNGHVREGQRVYVTCFGGSMQEMVVSGAVGEGDELRADVNTALSEAEIAHEAAEAAVEDAGLAKQAAQQAAGSAESAATSAANAASSASNAEADARRAEQSATSAQSSASTAATAASNAQTSAGQAAQSASDAQGSASTAASAAQQATQDAAEALRQSGLAQTAADTAIEQSGRAETAARQATTHANSALVQLSTVEDVIGTVNWIAEHGEYVKTTDTAIDPDKVYYVKQGDLYHPVAEPDVADISTYYELHVDDALSDFVASHIALTDAGLYVLKDADAWKTLVRNDGFEVQDPVGVAAISVDGATGIGFDANRPMRIGTDSAFIIFTPASGSDPATIQIGGANVRIGGLAPSELAGSRIWTATADPTTPNYTFARSALTGASGAPRVGDLVVRGYYRYTVSSVASSTVLTGNRTSIRGATGAQGPQGPQGEQGPQGAAGHSPEVTSTKNADGSVTILVDGTATSTVDAGEDGHSPTVTTTKNADGSVTIYVDGTASSTVEAGTDGTSYYTYVRYSKNANGSGMVTTPTAETKYIGVYTGTSSSVPAYTSFKWSKYVGDDAAPLTVTATSVDYILSTSGTNPPADSASWQASPLAPTTTQYLWTRTTLTFSDGTTAKSYSIGGKVGEKGDSGPEAYVTITPSNIKWDAGTATLTATLHVNGTEVTPTKYEWAKGDTALSSTGKTCGATDLNATYSCTCTWSGGKQRGTIDFAASNSVKLLAEAGFETADGKYATKTELSTSADGIRTSVAETYATKTALNTETALRKGAYATSTTAVGTAAKVATITPAVTGFSLYSGCTITVRFDKGNSAANPTLNVNGTGAKKIVVNATENPAADLVKWNAYQTCIFTYDGSYWRFIGSDGETVRLKNAETTIEQTANNVLIKATESDTTAAQGGQHLIQSLINVAPDGITIDADKVNIEGAAIFTGSGRLSSTSLNNAYDAKGSASAVQSNLDNLQVGGRNLLRETPTAYSKNAYLVYNIPTTIALNELEVGDTITMQLWGVDLDANTSGLMFYWGGGSIDLCASTMPDANGYWKATYELTSTDRSHAHAANKFVHIYNFVNGHSGASLSIERWKIERGNKGTDWSPAPEDVDDSISAIQVGGRNLLKCSKVSSENLAKVLSSGAAYTSFVTEDGYACYKVTGASTNGVLYGTNKASTDVAVVLEADTTYIYSAWIKVTTTASGVTYLDHHFTSLGHHQVYNTASTASDKAHEDVVAKRVYLPERVNVGEWTHITEQFTTNSLAGSYFGKYPKHSLGDAYTVYVRDIKLEKGTRATDWTPAPEDVDASIATAQTTANAAVKRTQRIYYRKATVGAPGVPTAWVVNGNVESSWTKYNAWSTRVPPISDSTASSTKYAYLYTCEQYETAGSTTPQYTTVLLDDSTTIIDGGNIITGSIAANRLSVYDATIQKIRADAIDTKSISIGDLTGSIGGRNILHGTRTMTAGDGKWSSTGTFRASGGTLSNVTTSGLPIQGVSGALRITNTGTSTASQIGFAQDGVSGLIAGETYTQSAWVRASTTMNIRHQPIWKSNTQTLNGTFVSVGTNWQYMSFTGTLLGAQADSYNAGYMYAQNPPAGAWFEVCGLKLEKSSKATDWTPAPEDVDASIATAQSTANSAIKRSQRIYYRSSTDQPPTSMPTAWVTESGNKWAANRTTVANWTTKVTPISNGTGASVTKYLYLWTCLQYQLADGSAPQYTTVLLDDSTTVIDGGNLITGSVTANKVSVTDLSAFEATIGGFTIDDTSIRSGALASVASGAVALAKAAFSRAINGTTRSLMLAIGSKFGVGADGTLYASGATVAGNITATSGTIGGASITNGTLKVKDANIDGKITANHIDASSISIGDLSGSIGGRNLLVGSSTGTGWTYSTFDANTAMYTRSTTATSESYIYGKTMTFEPGETYTLSCWAKSNGKVSSLDLFKVHVSGGGGHQSKTGIALTTSYQKVVWTFTCNATSSESAYIRFDNNGSTASGTEAILYIKEPKLEKGNRATDWTAAPEDFEIGGRNYAKTNVAIGTTSTSNGAKFTVAGPSTVKLSGTATSTGAGTNNWFGGLTLEPGTYSLWLTNTNGGTIWFRLGKGASRTHVYSTSGNYTRDTPYVFTVDAADSYWFGVVCAAGTYSNVTTSFMLERGSRGTSWVPATEDVSQYRVVTTNYSYTLSKWLEYATEGRNESWMQSAGQGVQVGDVVMLEGTNKDTGDPVYVLMTVNTVNSSGGITSATSHGLIDPTAGTRADSYLTDITSGGVMVHPSNDANTGVQITDKVDIKTASKVMNRIDTSGMTLFDGNGVAASNVVAKFASNLIELGKNSASAVIKLCSGLLNIRRISGGYLAATRSEISAPDRLSLYSGGDAYDQTLGYAYASLEYSQGDGGDIHLGAINPDGMGSLTLNSRSSALMSVNSDDDIWESLYVSPSAGFSYASLDNDGRTSVSSLTHSRANGFSINGSTGIKGVWAGTKTINVSNAKHVQLFTANELTSSLGFSVRGSNCVVFVCSGNQAKYMGLMTAELSTTDDVVRLSLDSTYTITGLPVNYTIIRFA